MCLLVETKGNNLIISTFQGRRDESITFPYREGYPCQDILNTPAVIDRTGASTVTLTGMTGTPSDMAPRGPNEVVRQRYVRRNSDDEGIGDRRMGEVANAPYVRNQAHNFRMIDASATDLR